MLIDLILDRKDGVLFDPAEFAQQVKEYAEIFPVCEPVAQAIDSGKEWAVKIALETYLERVGCACTDLFEYVESVSWLCKRTFIAYYSSPGGSRQYVFYAAAKDAERIARENCGKGEILTILR